MKTIDERIEFLRHCANLYESGGDSPLTDAEYDKEYYDLKAIVPDHPFFEEVGGLQEERIYGAKYKHESIMGSLAKSPNPDDFEQYFKENWPAGKYVIEPKVDGLSLSCHYEGGKLVRVVTRGDGYTGVDVTANAIHMKGIKQTVSCKDKFEVRGEGYKNRQDFYKDWALEYANPRNFAAGSINQKDPTVTKKRGLSFVAYQVVGLDFDTEEEKHKFLFDENFENLKTMSYFVDGDAEAVANRLRNIMDGLDRDGLKFDIDGMVVKPNDIVTASKMGYTAGGKKPKWQRAVKFPVEQKETRVASIEWNVGRTGQITPVALLEPVELAGTTVKRATLHNLKFMQEMGIQVNCKVLLQKSGDIIPYIVKKTEDGDHAFFPPTNCPSCAKEVFTDSNGVSLWCKNPNCPAQLVSKIEHWFKKLDVKGIGPKIIQRLCGVTDAVDEYNHTFYFNPLVTSISSIYELDDKEDAIADMFGDKAAKNILKAIDSVKEIPLSKFIEALGIGKIGTMSKEIVAIAPTVAAVDGLVELNGKPLMDVEGFAETKISLFVDGWKEMRDEIDSILEHIKIVEPKMASSKLEGKKFCFTGSFSDPTRKEMEKMVEENGGKKASVSKNLTALVWDGEISGSKIDKAKKLGISIISQDDFMNLVD